LVIFIGRGKISVNRANSLINSKLVNKRMAKVGEERKKKFR